MSLAQNNAELIDLLKRHSTYPFSDDPVPFFLRQLLAEASEALRIATLQRSDSERVKDAVNRFLGWRLPADFCPDCYITFDKELCKRNNGAPIGTNLFDAIQARAMFEYCLTPVDPATPQHGTNKTDPESPLPQEGG